eukprot:TRINITY_DN6994_c0_g1_i8.p1 TRINITY_DN6994_c0_g1~~TRINITY_DN6994_c0_g1_i8.p1  ORF type:complete len:247 (+),score=-12.12 TRINITY_DN6994_c0_g1_i8:126-866(+)
MHSLALFIYLFFVIKQQSIIFLLINNKSCCLNPKKYIKQTVHYFYFIFNKYQLVTICPAFSQEKYAKSKLHINYYYLRHLVPSKKTNTNYYLTYQLLLLRSFCAKQENKNQIFLKQKLLQDFLQQETKKDKNNLFQQQFRGKLRLGTLAAMLDMIVHTYKCKLLPTKNHNQIKQQYGQNNTQFLILCWFDIMSWLFKLKSEIQCKIYVLIIWTRKTSLTQCLGYSNQSQKSSAKFTFQQFGREKPV